MPENAGAFENTRRPVPVSSVTALMRFALDGVASHVATPAPSPEIPVDTGRPVALVRVTADGVPRFGLTSVGEFANTNAPVPVSSPTIALSSAEVSISPAVSPPVIPSVEVATHCCPVPVDWST